MSQLWHPECPEDELLVAMVSLKRALLARTIGTDAGVFPLLHQLATSGPTRQGSLAELLRLDASTISRHVRGLVSEGLVEVAPDPADGRAIVLSLTARGQDRLTERMKANRALLRAATAEFTTQERAELVRLLHKLADSLVGEEEIA